MQLTKYMLAYSLIPLILEKEKINGTSFPFYLLGHQVSMIQLLDGFKKTFASEDLILEQFKIGMPLKL